MQNFEAIERNRLIIRSLAIGFLIFFVIVAYFSKTDGIVFIAVLSLIIGYVLAIIWKKIFPATKDDFDDKQRISFEDDLIR